MNTDEFRDRLAAAVTEHEAARAKYDAWTVPPQGDAPEEEYQAYEEAQDAEFRAWLAMEAAWRELDARRRRGVQGVISRVRLCVNGREYHWRTRRRRR